MFSKLIKINLPGIASRICPALPHSFAMPCRAHLQCLASRI
jgi:hypothetical protein